VTAGEANSTRAVGLLVGIWVTTVQNAVRLVIGLLAVLLAGYLLVWITGPPRHRIHEQTFAELQVGMTERQIETIFGVPAGDYRARDAYLPRCATGRRRKDAYFGFLGSLGQVTAWKEWKGDEAFISLGFDAQGQAVVSVFQRPIESMESFPAKVRRWLGIW
jgi:hypothetical protein